MRTKLFLILAALQTWRDRFNRRNPGLVEHVTRWSLLSWLIVLLYLQVLLPLALLLGIVRHAGASADTLSLDAPSRYLMIGAIALTLTTGSRLSGFARTVMNEFREQRWTLLFINAAAASFLFYIGTVVVATTAPLDPAKGDNGWFIVFVVAWVWAITRVCNVPIDRTRDSWDLGVPRPVRG